MNRRRWLACSACAPLLGCAAPPSGESAHLFIDAHVHLNDLAAQLELMERHAIPQAVVFWGGRSDNDTVLDAARRHPARLIPFASVSPEHARWRRLWTSDMPALQRELGALLAGGARCRCA